MSEESIKKLTLAEMIEKRNARKKAQGDSLYRGTFESEVEETVFEFTKLKPSVYYDLMDLYPIFKENIDTSKLDEEDSKIDLNSMNMKNIYYLNLATIYECIVVDGGKSLKDKDVQEFLGIDRKKLRGTDLIEETVLAYLGDESVEKVANAINKFSGIGTEKK